jgi:hypothetical protein
MLVSLWLALAACGTAELLPDTQLAPPGAASIVGPPAVFTGEANTVQVVNTGEWTRLWAATSGGPPQACPPELAPRCLALGHQAIVVGSARTAGQDVTFTVTPLAGWAGWDLRLQAASGPIGQPPLTRVVRIPMVDPAGDEDLDGLDNRGERAFGTDMFEADTDGDRALDGDEVAAGLDPLRPDTDGDGQSDWIELLDPTADQDGDDLNNGDERTLGTDVEQPDTDGDGWRDGYEVEQGTDPLRRDTDGDGLSDSDERGTDPTDEDSDDDGASDGAERRAHTDPADPDSDDDGSRDGLELRRGWDPLDPSDPWPDFADTADTGAEPACPPDQRRNCWGSCAPEALGDGVCNRWWDCPRYDADHLDCVGVDAPTICPPGTAEGCWNTCVASASRGDGVCDPALDCGIEGWDRGDCPIPPGATLSQYVVIDDAADLAALQGVAWLDGTLEIRAGAPTSITLPDLAGVTELIAAGVHDLALDLPALRAVDRDLRVTGAASFSAPALRSVRQDMLLYGAGDLTFPSLAVVGRDLTLTGRYWESVALSTPSLVSVGRDLFFSYVVETDVSALRTAGNLTITGLTTDPLLGALGSVDGELSVELYGATLALPSLFHADAVTVQGGSFAATIDGLVETTSLRVFDDSGAASALSAASLHTVEALNVRSASIDLPALTHVSDVDVDVQTAPFALPAVETARSVQITAGTIALPTLREAETLDLDAGMWGGDGSLTAPRLEHATWADITAVNVDAPVFVSADTLYLSSLPGPGYTLPALASVANMRTVLHSDVRLPALVDLGGLTIRWYDGVLHLDGIVDARPGAVWIVEGGTATLSAPQLSSLDTLLLRMGASVDLPALEHLGVLDLSCSGPAVGVRHHFPSLRTAQSVTADWLSPCIGAVEFPNATAIGSLNLQGVLGLHTLDLGALTDAGHIVLNHTTALQTVDLGSLVRVGVGIAQLPPELEPPPPLHLGASGLWITDANGLFTLDLASLESATTIWIVQTRGLADLRLPRLRRAQTLKLTEWYDTSWGMATVHTLLTPPTTTELHLTLPELESIGDLFVLHDRRVASVSVPRLTDVASRLRIHDAPSLRGLSAPALTTMTDQAWVNLVHVPAMTSLDLRGLRTAGRVAIVDTGLVSLNLPQLEVALDHLTAYDNLALTAWRFPAVSSARQIYLDNNPLLTDVRLDALAAVEAAWIVDQDALVRLSLPSLTAVSGALDVRNNDVLRVVLLPALQTAGEVHVLNNPAVDRCVVEQRLSSVAIAGVSEVDGPCAP